MSTEESGSGSYYDDGVCADSDSELELQGECDIIVDFASCLEVSAASKFVPASGRYFGHTAGMVGAMGSTVLAIIAAVLT